MDRNDTPTEKPKARIPSAVSVKLGRLPPFQCALLWTEEETGFEEKVEVVEVDVPPHKFETGTKNHERLAGTTAAINYLADLGAEFGAPFADEYPGSEGRRLHLKTAMSAIRAYERPLGEWLIAGLREIPDVTVYITAIYGFRLMAMIFMSRIKRPKVRLKCKPQNKRSGPRLDR